MKYPHSIRLRGPWQLAAEGSDERARRSGTLSVPADWSTLLGPEFRGQVRLSRQFGAPAVLDPHERVWLVLEGIDPCAEVELNGERLGHIVGYGLCVRFDVSAKLQTRNSLVLKLPSKPDGLQDAGVLRPGREHLAGGLIGEVQLEICSAHGLCDLSLNVVDEGSHAEILLSGRLVSAQDADDLALVVRTQERELAFANVIPGNFTLTGDASDLPHWHRPGSSGIRLAEIHVMLLSRGASLWETTLKTARRLIRWEVGHSTLEVDGQPAMLPAHPAPRYDEFDQVIEAITGSPSRSKRAPLGLRGIMRPEQYERLDRLGIAALQFVPQAWMQEVSRRLAHHPSIVAWVTDQPEQTIEGALSSEQSGRPCLVPDKAFG